jgi:hypothetical protein
MRALPPVSGEDLRYMTREADNNGTKMRGHTLPEQECEGGADSQWRFALARAILQA